MNAEHDAMDREMMEDARARKKRRTNDKEKRAIKESNCIPFCEKGEVIKNIHIFRAGSVGEINPPITIINIDTQIKFKPDDMESIRNFYNSEAIKISRALFESLPGGTLDALLCELMKKRSSMFSIPFGVSG